MRKWWRYLRSSFFVHEQSWKTVTIIWNSKPRYLAGHIRYICLSGETFAKYLTRIHLWYHNVSAFKNENANLCIFFPGYCWIDSLVLGWKGAFPPYLNAPREFSDAERRGRRGGGDEEGVVEAAAAAAGGRPRKAWRTSQASEPGDRLSIWFSLACAGTDWNRREAAVGMEEKKQFLCGVVEGKICRLLDHVENIIVVIIVVTYFWGEFEHSSNWPKYCSTPFL